ncbi:MAG: hypothetical protein ACYC0O_08015 [Desulfurivibrionaceae bacterium]|nr:hypothetical protein [Desulfobulbaceae bacterium]MDP2002292.1 hypothetical protein [Desulfurivibrionaceae bacterium]MDP2757530.1 hypothetical protein [Desulfurivibrionaceae bacterium]
MQRILLAQAGPGMILAKEILNPEGMVLCGAGTPLSPALIERLSGLDVVDVTVEGHPVNIEGEKTLQEELQEIDLRFQRVEDIAPLMYLKKRIQAKLAASRGLEAVTK